MTVRSLGRLALVAAFLFGQWLAEPGAAWAQPAQSATESQVKAAFLFKFASFAEWPAGTFQRADQPLVIAVSGDADLAADLERMVGDRTIDGRPVDVRRLSEVGPDTAAHVLYLASRREARLRDAIEAAEGPVLVVTEQPGALRLGSVLNFFSEAGRLRFSVSLAAAERRKLKLSARLLAVAQAVEGRNR